MKKFISLIFVLIFVTASFMGCSKESIFQSTELENVCISISDISSTGATVIIKDTNTEPFLYGSWYKIERKLNGEWCEIDPIIENYAFDFVGYLPDDNGVIEFTVDWEWLYGVMPAGKYRLLKLVDGQYISVAFDVV